MKIANETVAPSVVIFNSWKEIASYINRGVRTVQRWEAELGMPVRRPRGRGRSAVLAVRSELDRWIQACPLEAREKMSQSVTELSVNPAIEQLRTSTLQLHQIRSQMHDSREQLFVALSELSASVQKMAIMAVGGHLGDMLGQSPSKFPAA